MKIGRLFGDFWNTKIKGKFIEKDHERFGLILNESDNTVLEKVIHSNINEINGIYGIPDVLVDTQLNCYNSIPNVLYSSHNFNPNNSPILSEIAGSSSKLFRIRFWSSNQWQRPLDNYWISSPCLQFTLKLNMRLGTNQLHWYNFDGFECYRMHQ